MMGTESMKGEDSQKHLRINSRGEKRGGKWPSINEVVGEMRWTVDKQ